MENLGWMLTFAAAKETVRFQLAGISYQLCHLLT